MRPARRRHLAHAEVVRLQQVVERQTAKAAETVGVDDDERQRRSLSLGRAKQRLAYAREVQAKAVAA